MRNAPTSPVPSRRSGLSPAAGPPEVAGGRWSSVWSCCSPSRWLAVPCCCSSTRSRPRRLRPAPWSPTASPTGPFPYAVACQLFTSADVRAIEGKQADGSSVNGSYGVSFPERVPEDAAFSSFCTRHRQQDRAFQLTAVYEVTIAQYPNTAVIERRRRNPPKLGSSAIKDPTVRQKFGAGAILNRNVLSTSGALLLDFYHQNKAVSLGATAAPGRSDPLLRSKLIKLGERSLPASAPGPPRRAGSSWDRRAAG
jgi:hypothetical protein